MKKLWLIIAVTGLAVAAIPFGFALSKHTNSNKNQAKTQIAPIHVEAAKAVKTALPKQAEALGSLVADQSATISSEVNGRVVKIYFKDGQEVAKGMPIIQLDNATDKANYDSAVAALKVTQNKYKRAQLLSTEGAIAKQDLEQLKADVDSKAADVKTALAALNQKQLTAPFSGVLGSFNIHEGDTISEGDKLITLVNTDKLKAAYSLPESYGPELKLGQQVQITSHAYPKKVFYGTVIYIAPSVDVTTRSIAIQAQVINDHNLLSPGMFVSVTHDIAINKNALMIPAQALTADIQGYTVYRIVNNNAVLTRVKVGIQRAGFAQITQGLKEGDVIITAGQQKVEDGNPVIIVPSQTIIKESAS